MNGENEITAGDREDARAMAEEFGGDPDDAEFAAWSRRQADAAQSYVEVYGLSQTAGWALVKMDTEEAWVAGSDWVSEDTLQGLAEVRRMVWAGAPDEVIRRAANAAAAPIDEKRAAIWDELDPE